MEVLLGLKGKDFTIVAASKAAMRGVTILKATDDKTRKLNDHTIMAFSGEAGDTVQFAEYIQANVALYTTRNNYTLPPQSIASFTRGELARALRSRKPYNVNLLLGGIDVSSTTTTTADGAKSVSPSADQQKSTDAIAKTGIAKPKLYWIDYLASMAEVPYAAHGYAQYYCLSLLDKHHHPEMSLDAGLKLLRMCADELRRRLPIDYKGLYVKVITADGVRDEEGFMDESLGVVPA